LTSRQSAPEGDENADCVYRPSVECASTEGKRRGIFYPDVDVPTGTPLDKQKNEVIIYSRHNSQLPLEERDEHEVFHRRIDLRPEDLLMKPLNTLDTLAEESWRKYQTLSLAASCISD
jgi:hypothetical protein